MFHRIECEQKQNIHEIYYNRCMVYKINDLLRFVDTLLKEGKQFGSIEQCIQSRQYFHLSFDDGYKEHLIVARKLKEKYVIKQKHATFSINCGNSYTHEYTGMDVLYIAIILDKLNVINTFLKIPVSEKNIKVIKKELIKQTPQQLKKITEIVPELKKNLFNIFLDEKEIKELSAIFDVGCHGMSHRDMTKHIAVSRAEIMSAKYMLEHELNQNIKIFTYPEGKNNTQLQKICKSYGFIFALSISHFPENPFCVGRKII